MAVLVSSPKDLEKYVGRDVAPELFEYLESGGILRLEGREGRVRVVYPSKRMIRERLDELKERRKEIIHEMGKIRRMGRKGRFVDVLKVKHAVLKVFDAEYRELTEKIGAEKLLEDERGRKIVEELQRSKEYRERLRQALEESPVYRNRKFGDFVERTEEVKGKLLDERLERLEKVLEEVDREMEVLRGLLRWT